MISFDLVWLLSLKRTKIQGLVMQTISKNVTQSWIAVNIQIKDLPVFV